MVFHRALGNNGGAIPSNMVVRLRPGTDAAFEETTRQEAVVRKRVLARLRAIELVNVLGLRVDVGKFGHARLHAKGQLIRGDTAVDLRVAERLGSAVRARAYLPAPFDSEPVDIWGQSREQWRARRSAG